jgi:Pup amidohydrolase
VGTTALVLEALGRGGFPETLQLADPLQAHLAISRDPDWRWMVRRAEGGTCRATDLQREIADWVEPRLSFSHPEQRAVLQAWRETLETLARAPLDLADRLDWVAKFSLLERFRAAEGLAWDDPWLQSLDLEYHLLDRGQGLYFGLESAGAILPWVSEAAVLAAISEPPASTRAYLRGRVVQRFGGSLAAAHWDHLIFHHAGRSYRLDLGKIWNTGELARLAAILDAAPDLAAFLKDAELQEEP